MKHKLLEHIFSIVFVTAVILALIILVRPDASLPQTAETSALSEYLSWDFIDFGDPLDRALFREIYDATHPGSMVSGDSLLQAIDAYRREQFTNELYKTGGEERGLTQKKLWKLGSMYIEFIATYVIVMLLSYYGAQTLGVIRFVRMKQHRSSHIAELVVHIQSSTSRTRSHFPFYRKSAILLAEAIIKGVFMMILFAPAYVIAYSMKTEFSSGSYIFMIVLGVISNGLLINYANRFYTFLVTESRKGYVETAIVKNLHNSYVWDVRDGIRRSSVLRVRKQFQGHVFQHIFVNAHVQFQRTLKDHASFLITGLVIIEMALNIQGHLSYEMLKNILYKQFDVVLSIILGIFLLVKMTEIIVDFWTGRVAKRYENRS